MDGKYAAKNIFISFQLFKEMTSGSRYYLCCEKASSAQTVSTGQLSSRCSAPEHVFRRPRQIKGRAHDKRGAVCNVEIKSELI